MTPAREMMLRQLIKMVGDETAAIEQRLGERPGWGMENYEERQQYDRRKDEELRALRERLQEKEGARFNNQGYACSMKLGGVGSSCTGGWNGLFRNWRNAAARRIEKEGAK